MADAAMILQELIAEHGGAERLSVAQLAMCRALAAALAEQEPQPKVISALTALLPDKSSAGADADYDLRRLDDHELAFLQHLLERAAGRKTARPPKHRHTSRELWALELAQLLDRIEHRAGKPCLRVKPTEAELLEIRNLALMIGSLTVDLRELWAGVPCAVCPVSGRSPLAAPETSAGDAPAAAQEALPPQPSKVVPIRQDLPKGRSIHAGAPLKGPSEPWRGHLPA